MTEISIIILTKNAGEKFKTVLSKVLDQDINKKFEVIVIDSSSEDTTLQIAQDFKINKIYIIPPEEFDHGLTRNLGTKLAEGKYLIYLPQDAIPFDGIWLRELIKPLETNSRIAGVFSRQVPYFEANIFEKFFLSFRYPETESLKQATSKQLTIEDVFFSNVGSCIRKEVLQEIYFPENIIMSEDTGWAKKVLEHGYFLFYNPKAAVYHSHNYDIIRVFQRNFDSGLSLEKLKLFSNKKYIKGAPAYFFQEIRFIIKKKGWLNFILLLPYLVFYETAHWTGFWLGRYHKILPYFLKKLVSLHKKYL